MGIGNTSSAALVAAKITGMPVAELAGRGTGLDDAGLAAKIRVLECAAQRTASHLSGYDALREYGGFEIAMMTGAMLGATGSGRVVLVDGFIATAAAVAARTLDPSLDSALVYAHLSAEAGHARLCTAIGAEPLLSLGLRLGEGTGALLAWPLLRAAAAMLSDMASFESAGVSRN
jgi:nicotinate-nucleotide--dimethylbenzimidazole phosphoribosyltransferase